MSSVHRYVPLYWLNDYTSPAPRFDTCLLVELGKNVLSPGATFWTDVLDIPENVSVMRLFFTVLNAVTALRLPFSLEILVDESFFTVHNQKLSDAVCPVGYRLWVPAGNVQRQLIHEHINEALTPRKVADLDSANTFKKRKRRALHACSEPFTYFEELRQSLEAYFAKSGVDTSMKIMDLLSAKTFFTAPGYGNRVKMSQLSERQARIESYTSNGNQFRPAEVLIECGLIRSYSTGPGGLLVASADELLSYLLPVYEPPRDVLVAKVIRLAAAAGHHISPLDVEKMDTADIVRIIDTNKDPTVYSPVYVDAGTSITDSVLESIVASEYHIMHSLKKSNTPLLNHHRHLSNATAISDAYRTISDQLCMLLGAPQVKGVPIVYGNMYKEAHDLLKIVRTPTTLANRLWTEHGTQDHRDYTPASHGINWLNWAAHECLRLLPSQMCVFVPTWLRSFSTTRIMSEVSAGYIFVGPNETGKSKSWKTIVSCIPQCAVRVIDSTSALALTGTTSANDLHVHVIDEYKYSSTSSTDPGMERAAKNVQSLTTSGYISHERLVVDPVTNEYVNRRYITLERRFTITSTNHVNQVPQSHLSRFCIMPIPTMTPEEHKQGPSPGQYKAGDDNQRTRDISSAWQYVLRTLNAQQAFYWSAEAAGAFSAIDTTCFEVFWNITETILGSDAMSMRRNGDVRDLAISVMVWNVIRTWYMDGLGALFNFERHVELMWYARNRYLRMEDVCIAYMFLESSRSTSRHAGAIMRTIKKQILVENGELVEDKPDSNWWRLCCTDKELTTRVSRANPHLGAGLCTKLLDTMRQGCTQGEPNLMKAGGEVDACLVNKRWISTVTTLEEAAIVRMMKAHAYIDSPMAHPDYDDETNWVFVSKFRNQLTGTQTPSFPDIAKLSRASVASALCTLRCRCIPGTQTPAIRLETTAAVAKYRPIDQPGGSPSSLAPDRSKIQGIEHACLVVHPSIWTHDPVIAESPADTMLRTALVVAGAYKGTRVTAGLGRSAEGVYKDHSYDIGMGDRASVTIKNPYYSQAAYGPGAVIHDLFDDEPVFTRTLKTIPLDESSNVEIRVRHRCESLTPVSDELAKTFASFIIKKQ